MAASFKGYESALRRGIAGRTPLLGKVLLALEDQSEGLQKDLSSMSDGGQKFAEVMLYIASRLTYSQV